MSKSDNAILCTSQKETSVHNDNTFLGDSERANENV